MASRLVLDLYREEGLTDLSYRIVSRIKMADIYSTTLFSVEQGSAWGSRCSGQFHVCEGVSVRLGGSCNCFAETRPDMSMLDADKVTYFDSIIEHFEMLLGSRCCMMRRLLNKRNSEIASIYLALQVSELPPYVC